MKSLANHRFYIASDLYSGAKHIHLLSQKVFVLLAPISFQPDKYNTFTKLVALAPQTYPGTYPQKFYT